MGRKAIYTDEERREKANERRRNWYARNKDNFKVYMENYEERKKEENPDYKTNLERSREFYKNVVKPLREAHKIMEQKGIVLTVK
jgi:hypothetical protein